MLELASVTGEIDCENERSGQLRNQPQKAEEQCLRSFTVAGLLLGAATAIISGGISRVRLASLAAQQSFFLPQFLVDMPTGSS